jgi:N-acyl-D-aspartate/D-glutamate deacylase
MNENEPLPSGQDFSIGLGEAVLRLIHLELKRIARTHPNPPQLASEREMLVKALNQYDLEVNMTCDQPAGLTNDLTAFQKAAETECCRVNQRLVGRRSSAPVVTTGPRAIKRR